MASFTSRFRIRHAGAIAFLIAAFTAPAWAVWPPPAANGEELAVWQAMAADIAKEHAAKPFKFWYAQSDFTAATFIASAMSDPDKLEFCGLTGPESQSMIAQLKTVNSEPVEVSSDAAEAAGFKLGHKKNPRFPYFALSRVVFDGERDSAWLSVELNGVRGYIARLDKTDGEWKKTSRCGGWYMPQD